MAEQLALFGIVVGVALLLSGIGFIVLALGGALRAARMDAAARAARREGHDGHRRLNRARAPRSRAAPAALDVPARYSGLEQSLLERVADELRAGRDPQLLHDVRAVRLGRAHRDVELARDLLVRVAEREQAQNVALAVGERVLLGALPLLRVGGDHPRAERRMHVAPAGGDVADGGDDVGVDGLLEDVAGRARRRTPRARSGGRPASRGSGPSPPARRGGRPESPRCRSCRA